MTEWGKPPCLESGASVFHNASLSTAPATDNKNPWQTITLNHANFCLDNGVHYKLYEPESGLARNFLVIAPDSPRERE